MKKRLEIGPNISQRFIKSGPKVQIHFDLNPRPGLFLDTYLTSYSSLILAFILVI
jgi:hypothetical protein